MGFTTGRNLKRRSILEKHAILKRLRIIEAEAVMNESGESIAKMNERLGIRGVAEVVAGNGGLAVVRITHEVASGEMYLHGAHVTGWKPAGAEEVLWMSAKSNWVVGKAIRGGVPICFPWFGPN